MVTNFEATAMGGRTLELATVPLPLAILAVRGATIEHDEAVLYRGHCHRCNATAPYHTEKCPYNAEVYGVKN